MRESRSTSRNRSPWTTPSVIVLLVATAVGTGLGVGGLSSHSAGRGADAMVATRGSHTAAEPAASGDPWGVIATVPVVSHPLASVYDRGKGEAFVLNSNVSYPYYWGNVSVISDATDGLVATIPVGKWPGAGAYDSGTGEVYVANFDSAAVSVVSDTTNAVVATVPVGPEPEGIVYDAGKSEVFVANAGSANVSVIADGSHKVVATVPVGKGPESLAYDSGKGEVFVANSGSGNVSVISDGTNKVVASIATGDEPDPVVYDGPQGELFVSNYESNSVSVISDVSNSVVYTFSVYEPGTLTYDAGANELFVPSGYFHIAIFSTATDEPVGTPAIGYATLSLPYNGHGLLFAGSFDGGYVDVISDATDSVVANVTVGTAPQALVCDGGNPGKVFVANYWSENVSVLAPTYSVTFTESGLPSGTPWFVNISGEPSLSSTTTTIPAELPNGSYSYSVATVNKSWAAIGGSFEVANAPVAEPVPFHLLTYAVRVTESGLPASVLADHGWTVVLNGTVLRSRTATISFLSVPNGSYPWLVGGPSGFRSSTVAHPTMTVAGPTSVPVTFSSGKTATLTFKEKGLPKGQSWSVELRGWGVLSSKGSLAYLNLTPGTYSYAVTSPLAGQKITGKVGKTVVGPTGSLNVTASESVSLQFAYPYAVTFTETGLTTETTWWVTIHGVTVTSTTTSLEFNLTNGTYGYKVGTAPGFTGSGSPKKVVVAGAPGSVSVAFKET